MGRGGGVGESGDSDTGGSQGLSLYQCPSCGKDTGSTAALYRHVDGRCPAQLGETMVVFRSKFRAKKDRVRYHQRLEEMRAQARHKVSESF